MDESGTDEAKCIRLVASGRMVARTIRSPVNARRLQLECARVSHESLLVPVLTYGSEKERSRTRAVQMDNLRGLPDIRRIDKAPNA